MNIATKNLTKSYGSKVAVSDLDLRIKPGQILGLLGPNGAGKSTTIKMLTGQLQPTSGEIIVDGKKYTSISEKQRYQMGVMPQEVIVWEHLNILENLEFTAKLHGMSHKKTKQRVEMLMSGLHLSGEAKTLARNLSGGYRRRVNLAISIIHDPAVVFLDEPTPGVDTQTRRFLWEFIKELGGDKNKSVVLTDHYLEEAERLSDYVVIIDEGKLVAEGTVAQLKKEHGHGTAIEIRLPEEIKQGELSALRAALSETFSSVNYSDSLITVLVEDGLDSLGVVMRVLEQKKIKAVNLSLKEPTLEDVFLILTGKNIRE